MTVFGNGTNSYGILLCSIPHRPFDAQPGIGSAVKGRCSKDSLHRSLLRLHQIARGHRARHRTTKTLTMIFDLVRF